jgi:hypothetical protein
MWSESRTEQCFVIADGIDDLMLSANAHQLSTQSHDHNQFEEVKQELQKR